MAGETFRTVRLGVEGMGCAGCAASLETLLRQARGVREVSVSFPESAARIEYDPEQVTAGHLTALLREAGYGVEGWTAAGT